MSNLYVNHIDLHPAVGDIRGVLNEVESLAGRWEGMCIHLGLPPSDIEATAKKYHHEGRAAFYFSTEFLGWANVSILLIQFRIVTLHWCGNQASISWSMYSACSAEVASPTAWPGNEEAVQTLEL